MLQSYLKTEGLNTVVIQMIYDSSLLQKIYITIDEGTCILSKKQIEMYQKEQKKLILFLMISYHNSVGYALWILVIFWVDLVIKFFFVL